MNKLNVNDLANFIWSIADLLRGDYKQSEYGKVILPLTVLRRLDCVLEPTKQAILDYLPQTKGLSPEAADTVLKRKARISFYNKSKFDFQKLVADPGDIAANLRNYITGFSKNTRDILEHFNFEDHIERLDKADLLFLVVRRFAEVDLHPEAVSNIEMGYIFEELIRKFADLSNETAGEHFTPREVIRLMVDILFLNDRDVLTKKGIVKTLYDPACGTGGMLSVAEEYLRKLHPDATLKVFGQELNPESYAICNSDMLIKGQNTDHIKFGNSFTQDGLKNEKFDYMLSNPPFGVEWKKIESEVTKESEILGFSGRFGAGLPRINDGSFLFLQHMLSKMRPSKEGGSRIAIVFNRSPLYAGDAESGESNIREWIINNDWLEAILALPTELFYNTGIPTYIWVLSNRKSKDRVKKVQLIDASDLFTPLRKSLGEKQKEISNEQIARITQIYGDFSESECSKIFNIDDFRYTKIIVERPLRLIFQITKERLDGLKSLKFFNQSAQGKKKTPIPSVEEVVDALSMIDLIFYERSKFIQAITERFDQRGLKLSDSLLKVMLLAFSTKDPLGTICINDDGKTLPDSDLRDSENVPFAEKIDDYFQREVKPYYPDAWVDESKSKKLVEIPFMRNFIKHEQKRSINVIIKELLECLDSAQKTIEGGSK